MEGKVDNYYTETPITCDSGEVQIQSIDESITVDSQDELDFWEPVEIPDTLTKFADGQILEKFILEEEIEFQGIDKCKIVELQDEQDIERCIASEKVGLPEMPVRITYDQEECIEEEICDMSLPEMYSTEESIHTAELRLETPIINEVEINEIPREVKLEMPIEQNEPKLVQNVTLLSNIPTPSHNYHQPLIEQEITLPDRNIAQSMTKGEISVPNRNIPGKSIPKLHNRCRKVLGSKLVRRVIPTKLVRTIVPSDTKSMCRPPPEPPYRQNNLTDKTSKRVLPSMNPK